MAFNYAIGVTGAAMVRYIEPHNRWARFAGTVLAGGYSANFPLIMSLMSGNFGGFTKKTTLNAMVCQTSPQAKLHHSDLLISQTNSPSSPTVPVTSLAPNSSSQMKRLPTIPVS